MPYKPVNVLEESERHQLQCLSCSIGQLNRKAALLQPAQERSQASNWKLKKKPVKEIARVPSRHIAGTVGQLYRTYTPG